MTLFFKFSVASLFPFLLLGLGMHSVAAKTHGRSFPKPISPIKTLPEPKLPVDISLAPQIVAIPAGCFQMGSQAHEAGRNKDEVQHRVCVNSFKLAKHEVTVDAFKQFAGATQFKTDADRNLEELGCWSYEQGLENLWDWRQAKNWLQPLQAFSGNKTDPVSCVSFNDVIAYIHWLNQRTGHEYRLPTEAEWEYAARAGSVTDRYWGNNPDFACNYANVADNTGLDGFKWTEKHDCVDGYFFSAPVASFRPNKYGLHGMMGNVWEWTCSVYQENYAGGELVCAGQANIHDQAIAIRGGAWNTDPARIRSACRNSGLAWSRQANLGFRLVRVR